MTESDSRARSDISPAVPREGATYEPLRPLLWGRALRDFGDGFLAVLLPVYLMTLGFSLFQIGALAGTALFGSAALALAMGFLGVR